MFIEKVIHPFTRVLLAGILSYHCLQFSISTFAESYLLATSSSAGATEEGAADRRELKHQSPESRHSMASTYFYNSPLAFKTFDPIN